MKTREKLAGVLRRMRMRLSAKVDFLLGAGHGDVFLVSTCPTDGIEQGTTLDLSALGNRLKLPPQDNEITGHFANSPAAS
jgi:hypothetical protein